jgi:chromosome segregation ATPase
MNESEVAALRASLEEHRAALAAWQRAHADLEQRLAESQQRATALESKLARRDAEGDTASRQQLAAARAELDQRVAEAHEREAALENQLAARDAEWRERLEAVRADFAASRSELAQLLAAAQDRVAVLEAELAERDAAPVEPAEPADRWNGAESHLLFFLGDQGYELVERDGPPPAPGTSVDGRVVLRVAAGPVPGNALPCAYLLD